MGILDIVILIVLALGIARGWSAGFVRQATRLAGLVLAVVLAATFMYALGMVVERQRTEDEEETITWYCETCGNMLHQFKGVITARIEYLNGCLQYQVKSKHMKDGLPVDSVWIDEEQLEHFGEPLLLSAAPVAASGGPHDSPPMRDHPPTGG